MQRCRITLRLLAAIAILTGIFLGGAATAKTLSAIFIGAPEAVFDTKTQACELIDIPDISAQAFVDQNNLVHLLASAAVARAMVGPDLNHLTRRCNVVYSSPKDTNPADFSDYNWLSGFFTTDGRNIAALVHTEFHGSQIPGMCDLPVTGPHSINFGCWWDTITYAVSHDGGNSFTVPKPPANLVASLPYRYAKGDQGRPGGYRQPTGIVRIGSLYYAMIENWPFRAQAFGTCLIRTANPFDPKSWRAWDGSDFTIEFVDPYRVADADPARHLCQPVAPKELPNIDSLSYLQAEGVFVATQITHDRRFGTPGVYLNMSPDLIHWSPPVLLTGLDTMLAAEPPGRWDYRYLSLLDPASTDRDFVTITNSPYLYYTRLDKLRGAYIRTLMRRQIRLTVGE